MKQLMRGMLVLTVMLMLAAPGFALSVGDPAPDFTLVDTDGMSHTLSDYQGKVVFLNFMGCT